MQGIFILVLVVLLQVCDAQERCVPITKQQQRSKDREVRTFISKETAQAFRKVRPAKVDSEVRKQLRDRKIRKPRNPFGKLKTELMEANKFARTFKIKPFGTDLCPQKYQKIRVGPWTFHKNLFCFVPRPYSTYMFLNIICPCCTPCKFPFNPCGFYRCLPDAKRIYYVPGLCWEKKVVNGATIWQIVGWRKIPIVTHLSCCCKRFLFLAAKSN